MSQNQSQIVKDETLNQQLLELGYIVIPFLNPDAIKELKSLFHSQHQVKEIKQLFVSSMHTNETEIETINDKIKELFKPSIDNYFQFVQHLGGTFIAKAPDPNNLLQPHQDWNIVDETNYRSYTIWVALQDVSSENGAMYVLPKSHNLVRGYRHLTIPSVYGKIYDNVWKKMKPIYLKAGEAIVFDHALGHASLPNKSNSIRIAATHTLISENAELRFYWNNNGIIEEYQGERSYYIQKAAKSGPSHLKKIKDLDFKMHQLDEREFQKLFSYESPIITKLKNLFFNK
jgi:hypothetical protein